MLRFFRTLSLIEGSSLLILLFIAMPIKYYLGFPMAVMIVGSIHGLLFLMYMVISLTVSHQQNWSMFRWLVIFIAGVLPFGCFIVDSHLKKELLVAEAA